VVVEERPERWEGRTLLHVALHGDAVGRVRFVVSLPDPMPSGRIPVVVVLGGLGGGSNAVRDLSSVAGDPGPTAFVGYDWPLPEREPSVAEIVLRLAAFRRGVLSVPGQVDAIVAWASGRPWADPHRVSLLGFSLGTFVVPASQRLLEQRGATVGWTVLAYAGAPIGDVIAGHPRAGPAWLRPILGAGADLLLRPIEPSFHLPHLRGRFLVLGAATDRLIAPEAAQRLAQLTPEPRTVVLIQGDHMGVGPDRWKLLARVIEVTRSWLVEQGAIEPTGARVRPPSGRRRRRRLVTSPACSAPRTACPCSRSG
jgi:dienelactone hydrolase